MSEKHRRQPPREVGVGESKIDLSKSTTNPESPISKRPPAGTWFEVNGAFHGAHKPDSFHPGRRVWVRGNYNDDWVRGEIVQEGAPYEKQEICSVKILNGFKIDQILQIPWTDKLKILGCSEGSQSSVNLSSNKAPKSTYGLLRERNYPPIHPDPLPDMEQVILNSKKKGKLSLVPKPKQDDQK